MSGSSESLVLYLGPSVLALVALQRLAEVGLARRNAARLLAEGGREAGAGHYPLFIALHAAWLGAIGLWLVHGPTVLHWPLLGIFLVLQVGRVWVIRSLGSAWTTRIIVVPGRPLVRRGPYRIVRHPNYLIVALEIAVLPLAFGAHAIAIGFTVLNGLLLAHRIRVEEKALRSAAGTDEI